jgi:competence protein ComEC
MLVVVTGGGPSIIRAAIMGEITLLGLLFERQKEFYTALAASALLLLIFDPQSLFDIGFQLSFTATWSLVYIAPVLEKKLPKILAISIAPIIATAPIIAFYFSQVTIGAVVSNLLVLPWVEFLVVLGFSATMVGFVLLPLAQILGGTIWLMLAFLDAVAQMVAALPGACFYLKAPAIPLIAGYYLGLIALIEVLRSDEKPVFTPRRIAVVFLLIFSVFVWNYVVSAEPLGDNGLTVTFLDVGQGDAILVETPERMNILIDGGGTDQGEGDQAKKDFVGQKVVVPFLRRKGINRLDLMVLTHPHADHMGGLIPVLKEIKIDQVLDSGQTYDSQAYRRFKALIAANKIKYSVARSGQNIRFGRDLSGSILNPVVPYLGNANSDSIVMRLVYKDISFLFTGDLEREGEERLLGQRLRSTILKVGHHGSSTSTSDQFLRAVSPKVAVISVGAHNRYRHPFPGTIMKLERSGIRLYRTDEDGAVVIKTDGDQFSVEPQRRSRSPRTHSLSSGWQGRGKALRWPRPG